VVWVSLKGFSPFCCCVLAPQSCECAFSKALLKKILTPLGAETVVVLRVLLGDCGRAGECPFLSKVSDPTSISNVSDLPASPVYLLY